jgi:hypothetical protein
MHRQFLHKPQPLKFTFTSTHITSLLTLHCTTTLNMYTGLLKEVSVAEGAGYYGGASRGKKSTGASPLGESLVSTSGKSLTWAYGGDYNEPVTDGDFCINGLISPDRTVSCIVLLHNRAF